MKWRLWLVFILMVGSVGCRPDDGGGEVVLAATETQVPTVTVERMTPTAIPTVAPTEIPTIPTVDLSLSRDQVVVYPVPVVYAGDKISLQLRPTVPELVTPQGVGVEIFINGQLVTEGVLGWHHLAREAVGMFEWVWDTTGLDGDHIVEIRLDPDNLIEIGDENPNNNDVQFILEVASAAGLPRAEQAAEWVVTEMPCCYLYTIRGTAAHRDLVQLQSVSSLAVKTMSDRLGEIPQQKFHIYFIERVIGQGGYANTGMVISYLDRDYAGGGLYEVIAHESVHILDQQFATKRLTFLAEGMAVWGTQGHYKREDLRLRMAALVQMEMYTPLGDLVDDFYPTQHEIGYLQAAGFVQHLVDNYGWEAVKTFYATAQPREGVMPSHVLDQALLRNFGKSLKQLEREWLTVLRGEVVPAEVTADLQATLRFYQVMRRYQLAYDPTAHFLQAWLPYPQEAVSLGVTADFMRQQTDELNVVLEVMLQAADSALREGDYQTVHLILDSVERTLAYGNFVDPLGSSYQGVVRSAEGLGYNVQQVSMTGDKAVVVVQSGPWATLKEIDFVLRERQWTLAH
ncbi:MAG TPA: hypothetical protein VLL52_05130 [Anaerolineae bacterium]|nr:hypothetical protein [Anaerolineae bacterium]